MEDKILQRLEEYKNSFPAKFEENARYVVQRCIRMVKDELAGLESKNVQSEA